MSRLVIEVFAQRFEDQKKMVEKAVMQLSDEKLHVPLDENTNSIAVIMKHMAGNLRSRFMDFLTTDGEKPDRDRDAEFVEDHAAREAILKDWVSAWQVLLGTLASLTDEDLGRTITIRGQPHTVIDALLRALAHQSYHTGQIVQVARHLAGERWKTLTIPRNASKQFNATMEKKFGKFEKRSSR